MKILATLACLLFVATGFAQQRPSKHPIDSLGNIDNMPIHKSLGSALDIPTRKGQGDAVSIPNRPIPVTQTPGEYSTIVSQILKRQVEWFLADSTSRGKPGSTLPFKNK